MNQCAGYCGDWFSSDDHSYDESVLDFTTPVRECISAIRLRECMEALEICGREPGCYSKEGAGMAEKGQRKTSDNGKNKKKVNSSSSCSKSNTARPITTATSNSNHDDDEYRCQLLRTITKRNTKEYSDSDDEKLVTMMVSVATFMMGFVRLTPDVRNDCLQQVFGTVRTKYTACPSGKKMARSSSASCLEPAAFGSAQRTFVMVMR